MKLSLKHGPVAVLVKNDALRAFLLNLIAAAIGFGIFVIANGGPFAVAGDFNVQQIPFAMHANDAIKSGNVVWDWSLDLGSNFIGGMMFYVLGNPSFWLSLLFPSDSFIYIVAWIYVLKYAFAGLTSYLWLRRHIRNSSFAVTASMLYAFSGFMHEDLLFYHFHDVVALFPLLLLTFELLVEENRRGPFIFAVTLNLLVNYFFFPGEVLFLAVYFILRYVYEGGRSEWKKLPVILIEGILGCMIGAVLLMPAAIFVMQNPRVKFDYVGSNSLVFGAERYLFILKSMIFPGEVMSDQSAVINHNFSSCAAYLPMVGMVPVIAFLSMKNKKGHWVRRMLLWCLIMAVVPILNAVFSLFAGLYHRWYYMPVLLFSLCTAIVLEQIEADSDIWHSMTPAEGAVQKGMIIWSLITGAFIAFLAFVPWSSSDKSKIYRADLFIAWSAVSVAGTIFTWIILTQLKKRKREILTAGIFIFSTATLIATIKLYNIANVEDAVHLQDRLVTSANLPDPGPMYRYTNTDNPETLTHGYSTTANFCSTVSGSIFRFYTSLGLKRDVKSPKPPAGLHNLVSARYTYETSQKDEGVLIGKAKGKYRTYYVYKNESVPPIGFTYDTYMTASEFAETPEANRAVIMLKTLVIPDEAEEEVSKSLRRYNAADDGSAAEEYITSISASHLAECSTDVVRTTSSYSSTITADSDKYAFFSIPNDSGWSAEVDGVKSEILDINGFMAVKIHKGENRIEFRYTVPGLRWGRILSVLGILLTAGYLLFMRRRRTGKGVAHKSRNHQ